MLDAILSIQPKDSGGGGGETRESVVYSMSTDMLEKLPPDYVPYEVKERLQKMGILQPMNIFLRQEIDRMQKVIGLVRSTLTDLKLAIDGTIIMSENLRDALDCMFDAHIPNSWFKVQLCPHSQVLGLRSDIAHIPKSWFKVRLCPHSQVFGLRSDFAHIPKSLV